MTTTGTATVASDGRVAIPPDLREALGLRPGDAVAFALDAGGARLLVTKAAAGEGAAAVASPPTTRPAGRPLTPPPVPPPDPNSRFGRVRGSMTTGLSTDEIMAMTRGWGDPEEEVVHARAAELIRKEGL